MTELLRQAIALTCLQAIAPSLLFFDDREQARAALGLPLKQEAIAPKKKTLSQLPTQLIDQSRRKTDNSQAYPNRYD
jgi:hypothetical protein